MFANVKLVMPSELKGPNLEKIQQMIELTKKVLFESNVLRKEDISKEKIKHQFSDPVSKDTKEFKESQTSLNSPSFAWNKNIQVELNDFKYKRLIGSNPLVRVWFYFCFFYF